MEQFLKPVKSVIKSWWVSLLLGILYIALAIWIFTQPIEGYAAITLAFSIILFISGMMEIFFAIINRDSLSGWGWYLTGGILDLIIGFILISYPELTMALLPFFFGFWLLFRSIMTIGTSFDLQAYNIKGWGLTLAFGILAMIFAFWVLINPIIGGMSILILTSMALIFLGAFRIALSLYLYKLHKAAKG